MPHSTFSDFEHGAGYRKPKRVAKEFVDLPNYYLKGKAFDAQHLDNFIRSMGVSDSVGACTSLSRMDQLHNNSSMITVTNIGKPPVAEEEDGLVQQEAADDDYASAPSGASLNAPGGKLNSLLKRTSQQVRSQVDPPTLAQPKASTEAFMAASEATQGQSQAMSHRQPTSAVYSSGHKPQAKPPGFLSVRSGVTVSLEGGASRFDTMSYKTVRPSTSFINITRQEAIARHSQAPLSLFNPLTD